MEETGGKKDNGEAKSPQSRPQEMGKVKRSNPQIDQNPRAKKRNRNEELGTSELVEETVDKEQTPNTKLRTRSKIPNSLREEVMNQRGGAKTISENRADLADPVFALGEQEGRKSRPIPENYGVDQGQKLFGVKGCHWG